MLQETLVTVGVADDEGDVSTSRSINRSDASVKQISDGSCYLKTNKRSQQPKDKR